VFAEPDILRVQAALVEHCRVRDDRIAILDAPLDRARPDGGAVGSMREWRRLFEARHAALYYPWLEVPDPLGAEPTRSVPPSGHVAGQFAGADLEVGVHRAAANRRLCWVEGVTLPLGEADHGLLNREGINAIRAAPGRGLRILGARTLSSDPDWRFVNVQRLIMMIKKAFDRSTQWAAFEPNDARTRMKIAASIDSYLRALWQAGAFAGAFPAASYFVKCDAENNSPDLRDRGRLVADVGVAPSIPFEFVLVRIGREGNQLEITEVGRMGGGV
jgi:phage tail sheath protein FI